MVRRLWVSLIGIIVITTALVIGNLATDNAPILGLDLQGGVSVILAPTEDTSADDLIVIRDLIRDELERGGIAEPDVRVQGETIVVDLPGVKDQQQALDSVDVSGIVELRPVLNAADCATAATEDQLEDPTQPPPAGANGAEFLPNLEGATVCVGPPGGTGEIFERGSAEVQLDSASGWSVTVNLRGDGKDQWNTLATECYNNTALCPSTVPGSRGQLAIVLDSVVQSSPQVNTPVFDDNVSITGSFSEDEARSLARVLNRGAFPVEVQAQEARTVSASAGSGSLRAGIIAGIVGAILLMLYLLAYYRWIALVVVGGMIVWGMTVFAISSLVSGWTNYALTLAGITGIIVAIGVTVDSYIVFFERMKDEIRNGRTLRNAAPRSFAATWRTIWTADLVSALGAAVLFWLSVGSVRGFALYLGITTFCDLIVCFFFTRPAVILLARSKFMVGRRAFGLDVAK